MTDTPLPLLTAVFIFLVLAEVGIRRWLIRRQQRCLRAGRDRVPADFAAFVTLDQHQKACDYGCARLRLAGLEQLPSAALALALTVGGGLAAFAGWSGELSDHPLVQGTVLILLLIALSWAVGLPFALYRTFVVETRFGFNRQTGRGFIADLLRSFALLVVIGIPLIAVALWLMAQAGNLWWIWVWALWMGVNLLALWLWPVLIAPLFNRFTPLDDDTLRAHITTLLGRAGFDAGEVLVMDGSRRSGHGNAYFTGFGRKRRIVFFDTLLQGFEPRHILAVLAHELGHFHHRHLLKRLVWLVPGSFAVMALAGWASQNPAVLAAFGVPAPSDAQALALLVLVLPAFTFPLGPLMAHLSRRAEFEADAFAARLTSAGDLVDALRRLYIDNASPLITDPLYSRYHDSHPPASIRIERLQSLAE